MDLKRIYISSKMYIVLLIAALLVLILAAGIAYRQIKRMQLSAEMVTHTLHVNNAIALLSAHYTQAESEEFRQELLNRKSSSRSFISYRNEGDSIMDSLATLVIDNSSQQNRVRSISEWLAKLNMQLQAMDTITAAKNQRVNQTTKLHKDNINSILYSIRNLKNEMLAEERKLMRQRQADYDVKKYLAPLTLLILSFFALFVFIISFVRIYRNKLLIGKSEAFLRSVLATTDNIVNYYEPIFDSQKKINDFNIVFANECNRDYLGIEPNEIIGKPISQVFPFLMLNGEFDEMVRCWNKKGKVSFDREISYSGKKMWFQSLITPLSKGILVTARNTTGEQEAKQEQISLTEQLEIQNTTLSENRSFLNNLFQSITDVVIHLTSIRDKNGKIIDFKIEFVNDMINSITGDIPEEIKAKKVSETYPRILELGIFEHLVDAIENDRRVEYEFPYDKNGCKQWFRSTAVKLFDGVTITSREFTEDKEKERKLVELNEQLIIKNSILNNAEEVAKTGSYIWYLDTNTAQLSANFFRIIGEEPDSFQVTVENYRNYVHPEDLQLYDSIAGEKREKGQTSINKYRIVTNKGRIKHIYIKSKVSEKEGRPVSIGVIQDISERINNDENLRTKNLALSRSNAELQSFNRVASHDLQEPLRKIQMFISRIEAHEKNMLSDKGIFYFDKIGSAANRMQSLIINLLTYSRIGMKHEDFEEVDLNQVLIKVKDDLYSKIKQSSAIIKNEKLPVISGVAYQMEQLFNNIISNSIKYNKQDSNPNITIESEKVHQKQVLENFFKTSKHYYRITVVDSGIGFASEHSVKIFEVFKRLHQKSEYSGTGIGLAICKKIIQNHHGFIYATSELNKGSAFIFYLPA